MTTAQPSSSAPLLPPAAHEALRMIREEHRQLGAVIHGMLYLARRLPESGEPPLKVLRAMIYYVSEYPERLHHPKEDRYLFAPLRASSHAFDAEVAELERQHVEGEGWVHRLEHLLIRLEFEGARAHASFLQALEDYSSFYFRHMQLEEQVILPAAEKLLSGEAWQAMRNAFAANPDPLAGADVRGDLDRLFSLIVNVAPAPIGLGDAI